jgi:hypothetical protein
MQEDSGPGVTSSSAEEDEARASMSSCPQKHYVQIALRESLWQTLYKWSHFTNERWHENEVSRGHKTLTIMFKEEIFVQHRHWNGRMQNRASSNEANVFL